MQRLDRHDRIFITRRKRARTVRTRPQLWLWIGQSLAVFFAVVLVSAVVIAGAGVAVAYGVYTSYADQLPEAEAIEQQQEEFETVRIYDRTGSHLLYESVDPRPFRGDRTYVRLAEMSPWVWKAAVALEDRNFWENPGINMRGLMRAFVSNLQGGAVQGGSSITQQLIKNIIIPPEERAQQSYARKIKEVILALEVTRRYPKEKILEWYLNYNSYNNLAVGIEAASQVYFGKSSTELNVAEAAMLAPIPQFPALNPIDNPEEAKRRQGLALQAMVEAGYLTQAEAEAAFQMPLETRKSVAERFDILTAPHFALYVLDQVKREFNTAEDPYFIWKRGLTIYTTLDVELQQYAEQVAREQVARLTEQGKNANNAAVVAIKNDTGEILAMVGSLDYNNEEIDGQVNVAISERQPGSSFKPYVYLTALQEGMTAATMILDVATAFPQADGTYYRPENYDRQYHGPVSLRNALARSYNIPAIRVMNQVGVADALRLAHRMGINGLNRGLEYYGLSLVLGGGEVTLLDHTYAYSVFANQGVMVGEPVLPAERREGFRTLNPVSVLQVRDSVGNVLKKYETPTAERIFSAEVAYIMADIMSDDVARAPAFGANTALTLPDRKVAAKTGTTNGWKDNWTMGFTPQLTVGVWVGNTDNESMENVSGLDGAAPIWHAVMRKYHEGLPAIWYDRPPGLVNVTVCLPSGLLPTPACPGSSQRSEIFVAGTEPTIADNIWQAFEIDKETGQLASPLTPPERKETRVYQILPQEAADWVRENGIPQPPVEQATVSLEDFDPDAAIIEPGINGYIGGAFEIKGNARGGPYRLEYGAGLEPGEWIPIGGEQTNEVVNGPLGVFDTTGLAEGLYTLRLTVNRPEGPKVWTTPVTVDNTPPTAVISEPKPDQLYVMEDDEQINVNVLPNDTWAVDKVEFYIDNNLFATSTVAPFNERWKITMRDIAEIEAADTQNWLGFPSDDPDVQPGRARLFGDGFMAIRTAAGVYFESHVIKVRVVDRAGNSTMSEEVRVYVRHKKANAD
ncbi:MAG TPA: transglycosylase domain-containing protein [Caldilineaceae bacterium]|nr:transglycosylase domain-containing protein [Caldilineaceae bacterium]